MRTVAAAALASLALLGAVATEADAAPACTNAVIDGAPVCLRAGARCTTAADRQYAHAGYRCRKPRRGNRKRSKLTLGNALARRYGEPVTSAPDGSMDKATVLQSFAATVGPLPGVKVDRDKVSPQRDATGPIAWLKARRGQLTSAQRKAFDAYMEQMFPPAPAARAATADIKTIKTYVDDAVKRIQDRTGDTLDSSIDIGLAEVKDEKGKLVLAAADRGIGPDGKPVCRIAVTSLGLKETDAELRSTLIHETFHCFQSMWNPTGYSPATKWLWEGSATYAEADIGQTLGITDPVVVSWWMAWLTNPYASLFSREYGAVGFFAHMDHSGIDFWKTIKPMVKQSSNDASYGVARDRAEGEQMLDTLGPSYHRVTFPGPGWDFLGAAIPPKGKPPIPTYKLGNGGYRTIGSFAYSASPSLILLKAEVVTVSTPGGERTYGHWTDLSGEQVHALSAGEYCAKPGECKCPDGRPGPPGLIRGGGILVGVTGDRKAAKATFTGQSLNDWCLKAPRAGDMSYAGPMSGRITTAGECTTNFAGRPDSFYSEWRSDAEPYGYMVMYSPWGGGGNYLARERSINGPTVYISDGRGRTWSTADMPSGAENGGWQVTEESPSLIRGNVQAYLYNKDEGTTITVSGSWVCNRD